MTKGTWAYYADPAEIDRLATILGATSAAALALNEWRRRSAAGEQVSVYGTTSSWLVGPDMDERSPWRSVSP